MREVWIVEFWQPGYGWVPLPRLSCQSEGEARNVEFMAMYPGRIRSFVRRIFSPEAPTIFRVVKYVPEQS